MVYDLAGDVFARLQRLSLRFHSRRSVGDSLSRLMEDSWCIYSLADGLLIAPIQHILTLGMMIWIGFLLDPLLATLALAVAPLLAASSWYFGPQMKRRSHQLREARSRLVSPGPSVLGCFARRAGVRNGGSQQCGISKPGRQGGDSRTARNLARKLVWSDQRNHHDGWTCARLVRRRRACAVGRHIARHDAGFRGVCEADARRHRRSVRHLPEAENGASQHRTASRDSALR